MDARIRGNLGRLHGLFPHDQVGRRSFVSRAIRERGYLGYFGYLGYLGNLGNRTVINGKFKN